MPSTWHDINSPGFIVAPPKEKSSADEQVSPEIAASREVEVSLKNPRFEVPSSGLNFNDSCKLRVDVEYLKKTIRSRVLFDLIAVYKGTEEKIECGKEGHEKNGVAEVDVKTYYPSKYEGTDPVEYYFIATHSTGDKPAKSETISVPAKALIKVDFVEIADFHFHHNCALPCLDEKGELISALTGAFSYAKNTPDRELVVEGHADRSGNEDYNLRISKRRAESIKALLQNDVEMWNAVVASDQGDQKIETEDYQQTLKSLSVKYGWPCDPGKVDNQCGPQTREAVKQFQTRYNTDFPQNQQLTVDGSAGPRTWQALFHVMRDLLDKALRNANLDPAPALSYGYPEGDGIYPCGESSPVSGLEKSEKDRRVELIFYRKNDWSPAVAPVAGKKIDKKKDPVSEKDWEKSSVADVEIVEDCHLTISAISEFFAPSAESCPIKYKVKSGTCAAGSQATLAINDSAGNQVFAKNDLPINQSDEHTFMWDGKGADSTYVSFSKAPLSVYVEVTGKPENRSELKQIRLEIKEITCAVQGLDAQSRLVVNDPAAEIDICASVQLKKTDGTGALTEVPIKIAFSFSDPSNDNTEKNLSYQYSAGAYLGKRGDAASIYWKANASFTSSSSDSYKTGCDIDTCVTPGNADTGRTRVNFKPSGVGSDDFRIITKVMSSDGSAELYKKEHDAFAIWRQIKFALVYTMSGEAYIDAATTHAEIGPAFETVGANGAYVLYEREPVTTLNASLSAKYVGLYDSAAANKQANWPADFSPARLETAPNQMNPTAGELADYAYAGADPAELLKKNQAKAAIEVKAQLWFNAIVADYSARVTAWFNAAGLAAGNSLLAVQYYHPKLSNVGTDGQTNFWPAGISINLANPGSGLNTPGDPDQATWREVQGFNRGSISVIFKNYGTAARLQIVCRHEIGHGTKSAFKRADFGVGDHSASGLMTPYGGANTFSNADSQKLRGEL